MYHLLLILTAMKLMNKKVGFTFTVFFFKMRCSLSKGSFKNYVDNMRVVKIGHLLSTFRMKHVHFEVGGQKRGKNMST